MPSELKVSIGQSSDKGRKPSNQDFHGALIPRRPDLGAKGVVVAIADGISSSDVGAIAAESAVKSFLTDYFCTPDTWSVKTSAQRVIAAANSWLHAETRRSRYADDRDRGYVTTLSVLVLKGRTAHVLHVGDCRVARVAGRSLELLTEDHRVVVSSQESYLGRALGANPNVEIDCRAVAVETGDVFVLTSDGVHENLRASEIVAIVAACPDDLDAAAKMIVSAAYDAGADDNLTAQVVRVDEVPESEPVDLFGRARELPPAPPLDPPCEFDGFRVLRPLHASSRSHVYLAAEIATGATVALKVPSVDLRDNADYLRRFVMEEWVARRVDSPFVMKAHAPARPRAFLHLALEFVEGQTLWQWMADNPAPDLEAVRRIVEQIGKGLLAFHRREMIHQDLRPQNVLIDATGTARIIDFGSVKVAGVAELAASVGRDEMLGTLQYTAPECFAGQPSTDRSDIFSLGAIAYQMLTGRLPYGAEVARSATGGRLRRLRYAPVRDVRPTVPDWVDGAIRKAVHPDPSKRHQEVSEFLHDLRHQNASLAGVRAAPLIERDPLTFWKATTVVLAIAVVWLLALLMR